MSNFTYKGRSRVWNPKYLGLINHLVFVVDMSDSMRSLRLAVAKFLDAQRQVHAHKSEETGQETRISVYLFSGVGRIECVVYDRDVLRPLDFDSLLETRGMTALRDATMLAFNELRQTSVLHGDHAFWLNVITDGHENDSHQASISDVTAAVTRAGSNWTVTCFVPEGAGFVHGAQFGGGFPPEHIQTWNPSTEGVERLSATFTRAADTYYGGRTEGTQSFASSTLFGAGVSDQTVQAAALTEVAPSTFAVFTLSERIEAKPFCEQNGYRYKNGVVFYEWFNTQDIQPQKTVLFQRIRDGKVFTSTMGAQNARDLLGLAPGMLTRGKPAKNKDYRIFIQSTAPNRKLIPGKHALIIGATRLSSMARSAVSV
jgi:hypothetical protein